MEAGTDAEAVDGCCLLACFAFSGFLSCFLTELRPISPWMARPTMEWVLHHQLLIKKMLLQACLQPDLVFVIDLFGAFFVCGCGVDGVVLKPCFSV